MFPIIPLHLIYYYEFSSYCILLIIYPLLHLPSHHIVVNSIIIIIPLLLHYDIIYIYTHTVFIAH